MDGFLRFIEIFSVVGFVASVILVVGVSLRRRRYFRSLELQRNHFIAQRLIEQGYLINDDSPHSIEKLTTLLTDFDHEWQSEYRQDAPPDLLDKLAFYIGNGPPRSARI